MHAYDTPSRLATIYDLAIFTDLPAQRAVVRLPRSVATPGATRHRPSPSAAVTNEPEANRDAAGPTLAGEGAR